MFCFSNTFGDLKSTLNRSIKVGFALGMSFSLINGMDMNVDKGKNGDVTSIYEVRCSADYEKVGEGQYVVRVLNEEFVGNNKDKFKMVVNDGKEGKLRDKVDLNCVNSDRRLKICLKVVDNCNITDLSHMFDGCRSVRIILGLNNINTSEVTDMSYMFYECINLGWLQGMSEWNSNKVEDMFGMFYGCKSLKSLPDISKWNTINVTDMGGMFSGCSSLSVLPDISKWNTGNVENMSSMFEGCELLESLPDISKWNTSMVTNMNDMFKGYKALKEIPDKFKSAN